MYESNCQISFNSFKESVTSLSTMISALGSHLGHHPESDLVTDLNSGSILLANMDKSDHRISFNSLKKFAISLSAATRALSSPLVPYLERDLETDIYSDSTPIAIKMSPIAGSVSDDFKKATTSLQEVIKA
jgi:gamma-glutamylcysteine synthetase